MTENGSLPSAKNRRMPPTPPIQKGMAHRVDTSMDAVQHATPKPPIDLVFGCAQPQQLPPGHKAMLGSGELRDD